MRRQELCHHLDQVNKIRAQLLDTYSPPEQITKPYGMRSLVFRSRVERLSRHEHAFEEKLIKGLGLNWPSGHR